MLCDNCDGRRDDLRTSSLVVRNTLQAPCHHETWRESNKIKDLVDYLCLLGVKQRVFYMSTRTLTRWLPESKLRMCIRQVSFPVAFTAPAPIKRAANDFIA